MPTLTEAEFKATMQSPMTDVTAAAYPVIDIWPYVASVAAEVGLPPLVLQRQLVELVYRSGDGSHDHVLLPAGKQNVYVVIVVDRLQAAIIGHHVLDLNREYGLDYHRDSLPIQEEPMKFDAREEKSSQKKAEYLAWLTHETVRALQRAGGDPENLKAVAFLFINRAHEARLATAEIAEIAGVSVARAGLQGNEEEIFLDWIETFEPITAATHAEKTPKPWWRFWS